MEQTYTGGAADEKIKTHFARIIVTGKTDKPYYEIMYYDPKDKMCHIGYSSYDLGIVKGFLERYFVVDGINDPLFFAAGMTFGDAIQAAKLGKRIARQGWNGKGMYVFLAREVGFHTYADITDLPEDGFDVLDCLCMRTADGNICPGWLASQTDMLADDWRIVEV